MDNKCIGCGVTLQTNETTKRGYINPDIFYSEPEEMLCERCYQLKHYNRCIDVTINPEEFNGNIKKIQKDGGLVVNIVDVFDLEGTFIDDIRNLFPDNRILLVCNKFDIFLKTVNVNKIKNYIYDFLNSRNVFVNDVIIISSKNKEDIIRLMKYINKHKKDKNVFFFGTTNVGKSTLINSIIKFQYPDAKDLITVSNSLNTTLGFIKIALDKHEFLVDTPGIINPHQLTYYLDKSTLNLVMPQKFIKPLIYQLNPDQTLFINGFARIDFYEGERSSFVIYVSNKLNIHRTKLVNADEFYNRHLDDLLLVPNENERKRLGKLVSHSFEVTADEKKDITISGLGYFTVAGAGKITVTTFENIYVNIRKALV